MGTVTTVPVRLHLGCGQVRYDGYVGVDINPDVADVVCDLTQRWIWEDSSVDEIVAEDVFEHLPDKLHTLRELYRVLKPHGKALVQVPDASVGGGAFGDPTHVSFWALESFASIYMRPSQYHPGGYHFDVHAYPTEEQLIRVGDFYGTRRWIRAELRAVKES